MAKPLRHPPTDHARNYAQIAYEWAKEAAADKKGIRHNKWARLAAKRHLDDLSRSGDEFPFTFDEHHANDICDFVEKLPHVEGSWDSKTIKLEPVQIFILACIFGWRKKSDGLRRFTSVYIEMARKGAKSTLTAAVGLYCLSCESEVGPQVLVGATTGAQAMKVFKPAKSMVEKTAAYREAFGVEAWARSITCKATDGYMQPINAKSSTQDGHNPHVGILDELHAHKDRGLYDVIKSAFGSRKNPLLWVITTAGYNIDGVCYEQRKLVSKVLESVVEADHYFGIIFTLDEGDDELDESVWVKANPMLGVTPNIDSMRSYAKEAAASPETMVEFKTKRLNVWTTAKGAWLNMEQWKRGSNPVDLEELAHYPCYAGLDLSSTVDFTAFVLVWNVAGRLKVYPRLWLPEDAIEERTQKANLPYKVWRDQGFLLSTPGDVVDYEFIEREIKTLRDQLDIRHIGFDRWNATQTVNNLLSDGAPMVRMPQGPMTFNPPMRELERHLKARTFDHGGHPVLSWMASNVVARRDANDNLAPDRKNSEEKIDGIVALLMGLSLSMQLQEPEFDIAGAIA